MGYIPSVWVLGPIGGAVPSAERPFQQGLQSEAQLQSLSEIPKYDGIRGMAFENLCLHVWVLGLSGSDVVAGLNSRGYFGQGPRIVTGVRSQGPVLWPGKDGPHV